MAADGNRSAVREKVETIIGNGVQIAYATSGPASGEPLILIHGGEGSLAMYDTFRPLLGDGIRAIAYDQRDTGASRNPPTPYRMADLAQDCAALIRGLGYDKAHIFGVSYGGTIALQLAVTVPEVVGTLAVGATFPSASFGRGQEVARVLTLPPGERAEAMLGFLLSEQGQRSEPLVAETRSVLVRRRTDADARRIDALRGYDVADRLGGIAVPTLLVYGQDDPLAPPSVGQRIAAAIPGARLETLPRLRHGITLEGRHTTAALLREFVLAHPLTKDG